MSQSNHQGIAAHIAVIDGQPTTTTQDIADVYGKRHDDVLRIVRQRMNAVPDEWRFRNFAEASIDRPQTNGGTVAYPVIRMTKKGFHFVVGKFTGAKAVAHQIAFADEFERMESELLQLGITPTPSIDPRALMLSGQCSLQTTMPAEVAQAIEAKAWAMAREAFDLSRQHLERKVAHHAEIGLPAAVNPRLAMKAIDSTTLGNALAHQHTSYLQHIIKSMTVLQDMHSAMTATATKELMALSLPHA